MSEIANGNSATKTNDNICIPETKFNIEFVNVSSHEQNNWDDRRIKSEIEFINVSSIDHDTHSVNDSKSTVNEETNFENAIQSKIVKKENVDSIPKNVINTKIVKEEKIDSHSVDGSEVQIDETVTIKTEIDQVFLDEHVEPKNIRKNVRRKSRGKKINCTYPGCKIKFTKSSKLKRHLCMHTGERPYVCDFKDCDKAYTNGSYLKRHKLTHSDVREQFPCTYCNISFSEPHNLKRHCVRYHDNPLETSKFKRNCSECHFSCITRKILSKHMIEAHNRNLYKCDFCPKSFTEPSLLHRHLNTNLHKKFFCKICLLIFDKHDAFREHKKEHIVVYKEFTCDVCDKKFSYKNNLRHHVRGHEILNLFVCSYEDCKRVYNFRRNLDAHIASHHLGRKWSCNLCPMQLSSKQKLNGHIQKIHMNPLPRKPQPIQKNRKRRWDIGIPRKSAISEVCGLLLPPETERKFVYRKVIKRKSVEI